MERIRTKEDKYVSFRPSVAEESCPHCEAAIPAEAEFCPSCGARLAAWCTFCGADMEPGDTVCPECGQPSGGVECPRCGCISHRAFCSGCGEPLTRAAEREVERAAQDTKVQQVIRLMEEVAEIEEAAPVETPENTKEKARVIKNINQLLEEMLPPPGSTPQQQRGYYSARKIAFRTTKKMRVPVEWICNYCGCSHGNPSECARPQLGGKWIFQDRTVTTTEYRYEQ